ncbi:hypothetical protein [Methanobacterium sp. MBAC-LM]|uniref:hypothetical protein n=1 Tax=Methanobacterium sp. MBAC-LM TaxID=3412034 RepID=UPI003C747AC4
MNYKDDVELLKMKRITTLDLVIKKLIELDSEKKATCVAWVTFPYSEENLKTVETALRKLNWTAEEYILNHDEDFIFVEKDIDNH